MSQHVQIAASHATPIRFPLFRGIWRRSLPRAARLDLDSMSDHLKRDLGFSGGRISPVRDLLRD